MGVSIERCGKVRKRLREAGRREKLRLRLREATRRRERDGEGEEGVVTGSGTCHGCKEGVTYASLEATSVAESSEPARSVGDDIFLSQNGWGVGDYK